MDTFIGLGDGPEGIQLPTGLGMQLGAHPQALYTFGSMTATEKRAAVRYIQSATTGDDARRRIETAIRNLEQGSTLF